MGYETLTPKEFTEVQAWAAYRDDTRASEWPSGVEQSLATVGKIVDFLTLKGDAVTFKNLDAALLDVANTPAIFQKFQAQCVPNLRNAQGMISSQNLTRLFVCAHREFGKATVENMNLAVKLLASRGELTWETPLKSQAELDREREAKDATARVTDKGVNRIGGIEAHEVVNAAEQEAQRTVRAVYESASPSEQAEMSKLIARHRQAGLSWLISVTELSAMSWVKNVLAHPPGGSNHAERDAVRYQVGEVIKREMAAQNADPNDHATWLRSRRVIEREILSKYDRSIK